jgi:membrane protease YdiL (CAAX protease family)
LNVPIKQDATSLIASAIAITELVFLSVFPGDLQTDSVIAALILIAGLVMQRYFHLDAQEGTDDRGAQNIFVYSAMAVVVFLALNLYVPKLPLSVTAVIGTQLVPDKMFELLIAVAEEQFFRGFLANLLITRTNAGLGILMDGAIFAVYHFAVYGSSASDLGIVFGAGITLAFIDWKTGRVSPSIVGHVINNLL